MLLNLSRGATTSRLVRTAKSHLRHQSSPQQHTTTTGLPHQPSIHPMTTTNVAPPTTPSITTTQSRTLMSITTPIVPPTKKKSPRTKPQRKHPKPPHHQQRRYYEEYDRPFSLYKGTLDAFLVGSRHNYVRPSVTYAAGLGNTSLRHTKLHPEDYTHNIPLHKYLPQYLASLSNRRLGLYSTLIVFIFGMHLYVRYLRDNELYDRVTESIFAYKSKNFLIKQGEKIFLETVLIMYHEGLIEPVKQPFETDDLAEARFVGEINAMLAEIERHRDFRLSTIPLNFFEVLETQKENSWSYRFDMWLKKPLFTPKHKYIENKKEIEAEYNTAGDILNQQVGRLDLDPEAYGVGSRPHETLDSSGVGAIYGLFYPLLMRYHTIPTTLSVQAAPPTFDHAQRMGYAPLSKTAGRSKDNPKTTALSDHFQLDHRNLYDEGNKDSENYRGLNIRFLNRKAWDSDVPAEVYNSYYLQRCCNLIRRVKDVEHKIQGSFLDLGLAPSPYDVIKSYLHKPYRVLMERTWNAQADNFSPGDSPIFRYYYQHYNLVPYLNSLQFEMQELLTLRQRIVKIGRAVGIDPDLEMFSPQTLDYQDPFSPANQSRFVEQELKRLTVDNGTEVITLGPSGRVTNATLPHHIHPVEQKLNEHDSSRYIAGSSNSTDATSLLNVSQLDPAPHNATSKNGKNGHNGIVFFDDNTVSTITMAAKYKPKLPTPRTCGTLSLYKPINIPNLAEYIRNKSYNIKGLEVLVDSLYNAQATQTPKFYPCLGVSAEPIQQERVYTRALFNPLENAIGATEDEKYVRGLLGAIDTILLRNAGEYQRWLYLVPDDKKTLWEFIKQKLNLQGEASIGNTTALSPEELKKLREDNYLQRDKLPQQLADGYKGSWVPFSYKKEEVATKPTYYQSHAPAPYTWSETIYAFFGWDMNHTPTNEEMMDWAQANPDNGMTKGQLPWGNTDPNYVPAYTDHEEQARAAQEKAQSSWWSSWWQPPQ